MQEVSEAEAQQLASAFRPHRRPLWFAVFANVIMAALLLGVPYWRGHDRALQERRDFVQFTRCLIGGKAAEQPGLSLPRGEREHYAAKVLFAKPDWPRVCIPALRKLAQPEALFLWPSVKEAGGDLRAVVPIVERTLQRLSSARTHPLGRIPEQPLRALQKLQAASVLYAHAAGADIDIDNDALLLDPNSLGLASPARLPIMAGEQANLDVWSSDQTLEALALDGRGVSYLRVADGKIDRQRVRRTSFLRGVVRAGATPYAVWAMPETRCAERADHCVARPTGLAPFDKGGSELGDPTWTLAGHPAGRLDRVLAITETGRVDLVARATPEGALDLLRFRLPAPAPNPAGEHKAQSVAVTESWPVFAEQGPSSVQLSPGEPNAVFYAHDVTDTKTVAAAISFASSPALTLPLPAADGSGAWALSCSAGERRYLAYGSLSQLRLARVDGTSPSVELARRDVALKAPIDADNPAFDQVRLICRDQRAQLLFIDAAQRLSALNCRADDCAAPKSVAESVASFAALIDESGSLLAFSAGYQAPALRVISLDADGTARGPAVTPGACWEPVGGFCGTPTLLRDAQRVVLLAHDGADLLALESTDQGASFSTMSGLVVSGSFESSTTSPLKQHRLRKGLE
jgi:hypothetical protein